MRTRLTTCFVLGIVAGLSCWWTYENFSVGAAAAADDGVEVRFVVERDTRGRLRGHLVANVDGK
jgi:hypothetical protein